MNTKILKDLESLVLFLLFFITPVSAVAQFYDSDDEIRIYVEENWMNNFSSYPTFIVFNFNGEKGAILSCCNIIQHPKIDSNNYSKILEDENFFEKKIFSQDILLINLNNAKSNNNQVCYTFSEYTSDFVYGNRQFDTHIYFSQDGSEIYGFSGTRAGSNGANRIFKRINKEDFINLILSYKSKLNRSWR